MSIIKHHRVYFVECKGFIKIGSTTLPTRERLSSLQTGNPFVIKGLGTIECDCPRKTKSPRGKCDTESNIQGLFQSQKVKRLHPKAEWYHATDRLRAYIEKHAERYEKYKVYDSPR